MEVKFLFISILLYSGLLYGNVIDFEKFPDGTLTTDREEIFDDYLSAYGVTFSIIEPSEADNVFVFKNYPQIAKKGGVLTAFMSCIGDDMVLSYLDGIIDDSFLTDDGKIGQPSGDLLVEYSTPVQYASGLLIDIDKSSTKQEIFEVYSFDPNYVKIGTVTLDSQNMPDPVDCPNRGDGEAATWVFEFETPIIKYIRIKYTGSDSLSVSVSVSPWNKICIGDTVKLQANAQDGLLPYSYQWQHFSDSNWVNLNTEHIETVSPTETTNYRVIVTDFKSNQVISDIFKLPVCQRTADLNSDGCVDIEDFAIFVRHWLDGCD